MEDRCLEKMKYECNRLYSFQNKWLSAVQPEGLAAAGFYYVGPGDTVRCPFCRECVSDWTNGDRPLRRHMQKCPRCPFVLGQDVGNIPMLAGSRLVSESKRPRMADVRNRMLTYSNWQLDAPSPRDLAECGFFYTGVGDVVKCFFCGGCLGNWKTDDDPWEEHLKFFPTCGLVKRPDVAVSDIVEAATDIFPKTVVMEAVRRKGNVHSLDELCDDILKSESPRNDILKSESPREPSESPRESSEFPRESSDALVCKICMDKERDALFQPCGHLVACLKCSRSLADCPVCRRPIVNVIKSFLS